MVDTVKLVRDYLLTKTSVTSLLGTNNDGSIYVGPLPTEFDPDKGCGITVEGAGGPESNEIVALTDDRLGVSVWGPIDGQVLTRRVALAVFDALAGLTMFKNADGTLYRCKAAAGLTDLVDPDSKWSRSMTFYMVMAA